MRRSGGRGQVKAANALPFARPGLQRFEIEDAGRRVGDDAMRHAVLADFLGQGARIDAGNADNAARHQPVIEAHIRTPVGRRGGGVAEDGALGGTLGVIAELLDIVAVHADIANMREGEGDDLLHIGGVGENFLITGHGGVKADLAECIAHGAAAEALIDRAVRKNQYTRATFQKLSCHGVSSPFEKQTQPPGAQTAGQIGGDGRKVNC